MKLEHCTPLRYPGGKQRLTPFIRELLARNELLAGEYVEPYAGGAGVAMELLVHGDVEHVHLNDSSYPIFAFWNSVITQPDELCKRIMDAILDIDEWKRQRDIVREPSEHEEIEVGFSAFYLNRTNRSGVLTGGVIGGLAQTGKWKIGARFYKAELVRRINLIAEKANSITLHNWDAERFILSYIPTLPENTFVYCDPPYYVKSSRLYLNRYKQEDHVRIAEVIQTRLARKWVVSYDGAKEILDLYAERNSFLYDLQYNANRVYKGEEIFIFADDVLVPIESSLPYINHALEALADGNLVATGL
jgi:DNA adenine methylase